jgi:pilus assembly protein Flp/PilA
VLLVGLPPLTLNAVEPALREVAHVHSVPFPGASFDRAAEEFDADLVGVDVTYLVGASVAGLVALAAGGPLRLVGATVHRWQRVFDPLNQRMAACGGHPTTGARPQGGTRMMIEFMQQLAARMRRDESGQAMVEYALILGLVSVVAIGALTLIGTDVNGVLTAVQTALGAVPGA